MHQLELLDKIKVELTNKKAHLIFDKFTHLQRIILILSDFK